MTSLSVRGATLALAASVLLFVVACSGGSGSTPSVPTAPSRPEPGPPTGPSMWRLTGEIVTTSGERIEGARITLAGLEATTDADGRFAFQHQATSPTALTVTHPGLLERRIWIRGGVDQHVAPDPIALAPPFDLAFYRQFVRDALDGAGTATLRRWTMAPRFYLHAVDSAGNEVDTHTLQVTVAAIHDAVTQFSPFTPAAIEVGTADVSNRAGWVDVFFEPKPTQGEALCGRSTIGGDSGWIRLWLDICRPLADNTGRVSRLLVMHEVGHAMGFYHTVRGHVMQANIDETVTDVTDTERFHASLAYRRPVGNVDPDADPASSLSTFTAGAPVVVTCRR